MKLLKTLLLLAALIILVVALTGTYKFNVAQDDIYLEQEDGTFIRASDIEGAEVLKFTIGPEKVECIGEAQMKCLVVNGELFYDHIEGFEFTPGVEQTIVVARRDVENPPADASAYSYRRVEVLKSNKDGDPNANKYDFGNNGLDDDCDDPQDDGTCALDDDDDGDSFPIENEAVVNDENLLTQDGLTAYSWVWKETQYQGGTTVAPQDSSLFVALFSPDMQFSSSTDCNNVFGSYQANDPELSFGALASTKKFCAGEILEMDYTSNLSEVTGYSISQTNELSLSLENGGTMIFTIQEKDIQADQAQDAELSESSQTSESSEASEVSADEESDEDKATDYNSSRSNKSY